MARHGLLEDFLLSELHTKMKQTPFGTLLSSKTSPNTTSDSYGVFSYQPNLVARKFGLIQTYPSPFFKTKEDIKRPKNEQQWVMFKQNYFMLEQNVFNTTS